MISKQILLMTNDSRRESCGPKNLPDGADVVADLFPAAEIGPVPDQIHNYLSYSVAMYAKRIIKMVIANNAMLIAMLIMGRILKNNQGESRKY